MAPRPVHAAAAADGCPPDGVTMRGRHDGFGAQLAAMISVYSWAKRRRVVYCASRWEGLEHRGLLGSSSHAAELFDLVGGPRYGPAAAANTSSFQEMHAQLAVAHAAAPQTLALSAAYEAVVQWGHKGGWSGHSVDSARAVVTRGTKTRAKC